VTGIHKEQENTSGVIKDDARVFL